MNRLICVLTLGVLACGGGGGGSTGPTPSTGNGTFTAVIDGQSWVSTTTQTSGGGSGANQVPGIITMIGTRIINSTTFTTITLTLGYLAGPGSYPLGVNFVSTAGGLGQVTTSQGSAIGNWSTGFPGNAGTVTITSLTSSRIGGTFQFNAPAQPFTSAIGTKVVTSGAFDLPLPAGFTVAPATNKGSKVTANLGGASWNAATVVALGANGVFSLSASTDSFTVSLAPRTPVTAGTTYQIGSASTAASMTVVRLGAASQSWNSGTGNPVGTVTITSISATRVVGTFSATLVGSAGGTLAITNGTFDVRIDSP